MKSKIIFTRTWIPPEEEHAHLSKVGSVEIPNGLCYLAASTRKAGYKTEIIDSHAMNIQNEKLANLIINKKPKYVGISANTLNIYSAADLAKKIKNMSPSIKIIIGGPHITAVPVETLKRFPEIDIGVIGEGEITIVDLLNTIEKKEGLKKVKGIVYRKNNEIIVTEKREFIKNLDDLPLPAFDLLPDFKKYYKPPAWSLHQKMSALLITSRGCSGQCTFCDRSVFGNFCRTHSAKYVMKIIRKLYYKHGVRHLRLLEDNLLLFRDKLKGICNAIIKERLNLTWSCNSRADCVNLEILKLMKKAGCWQMAYGIETGEQKILDAEKKKITLNQTEKAVRLTKKAGIRVVGFNMIGHPLETIRSMKKTIDFNERIGVDDFKTEFLTPFPGTELYFTAEKYGTLDRDWRKMGVYKEPVFIPYGLTKELLFEWHKRGLWQFYLQPRVILSYIKQIKSLNDIKTLFLGASVILPMVFDR
jgi:radical SAM superfamily enzyme YgiQ (UPF0313 family)